MGIGIAAAPRWLGIFWAGGRQRCEEIDAKEHMHELLGCLCDHQRLQPMSCRHTAAAVKEEGRGRVVVMFGPLVVKAEEDVWHRA
jgi:hypothetical protein